MSTHRVAHGVDDVIVVVREDRQHLVGVLVDLEREQGKLVDGMSASRMNHDVDALQPLDPIFYRTGAFRAAVIRNPRACM